MKEPTGYGGVSIQVSDYVYIAVIGPLSKHGWADAAAGQAVVGRNVRGGLAVNHPRIRQRAEAATKGSGGFEDEEPLSSH